jgi:NDP-4-keto-2,6-dideoxyhexose 3-C-methyltransferase
MSVFPAPTARPEPPPGRDYTTITACRVCGSGKLTHLFSLGDQYVSDFVAADKIRSGRKCPIELVLCGECSLAQARHTAPQDFLYTRHYWYRSGVTLTMRDALRDVTRAAGRAVTLSPGDVVLDIGSNDGTLLRSYTTPGLVRIGVEPAVNLRREGSRGIDHLVSDFWSANAYYEGVRQADPHGMAPNAKVITACGMFYDLEDPNKFIADVARVLRPDGVFVAQLMCLPNMMKSNDVGNLAHEHLEFYSAKSLKTLFGRHGLEVFDHEENSVNGGSMRLFARHAGSRAGEGRPCRGLWEETGYDDPATYAEWFARQEDARRKVVGFVREVVGRGKSVWVYGASTKGNVILQWYGLGADLVAGAADRSPEKWGLHTAGTGILIHPEPFARVVRPDYFLVLPYAFVDEFVAREDEWLNGGGVFLVPLPEPYLIAKSAGVVTREKL